MERLQTKIAEVTVFRDGARITRTGKVSCKKGPVEIVVEGISEYAQPDSFRVQGEGPAIITAFDVTSKTIVMEPSEDQTAMVQELEELRAKRKEINDLIEIEQNHRDMTNLALTEFAEHFGLACAAGEGDPTRLAEMDEHYKNTLLESKKKLQEYNQELEKIDNRITVIEENLSKLYHSKTTEKQYGVNITLDAEQDAEVKLEIIYQINYAYWSAMYDLDVLEDETKLRRIALVTNNTKEKWENVVLTVSTAESTPVTAIEGVPLFIKEYIPPRKKSSRRARRAFGGGPPMAAAPPSPKVAEDEEMTLEEAPEPVQEYLSTATETESGIVIFTVPKPVTIPDDGERHPITLIEEKLEAEIFHYWYQDGFPEVLAYNKIKNGDTVILPGPMRVFSNGEFIGETAVELVSPHEKFEAGTRIAYDVKAKRELIERKVEKVGLTGKKRKIQYRYRLAIENFSKRTVSIEVKDRIPHSLSPRIEVKFDWRKHFKEEPQMGILEWDLKIPAGKKKEIEYEYEVEWEQEIDIADSLP